MRKPEERDELLRVVQQRGEAVSRVATRLGIPVSTAQRWMRNISAKPSSAERQTFVQVVPERATRSSVVVCLGPAHIEVRAGFDPRLLRDVVVALGGDA